MKLYLSGKYGAVHLIRPNHWDVSLRCLIALSTTGYFCTLGSSEPSPVSRTEGNICPVGHFCPQGSGAPRPCPVGSFLPEPGASALSQCHPCPPGQYCLSPGSSQPTGGDGGGWLWLRISWITAIRINVFPEVKRGEAIWLSLLGLCLPGFFCSGGADTPTPRVNSSLFGCICEILETYTTKTTFWVHNLYCSKNPSGNCDFLTFYWH